MLARMPIPLLLVSVIVLVSCRWSEKQAQEWYSKYEWGAGVNYTPAYADNQIEFWERLNLTAINQELKWAHQIGFSKLRVFLHISPYIQNSSQYLNNISQFVNVAKSHQMDVVFVFFDDCWKGQWNDGPQPQPIPGIHNSQWVQCPGSNAIPETTLKRYVIDIMFRFKDNKQVAVWDLYNEVGNSKKFEKSLPFLKKVFEWARAVDASQPLTSGIWNQDIAFEPINKYILEESDIISFHAYCDQACTKRHIERFKKYNRPVINTEYMARPLDSKFITHLPIFKQNNVWAINWGFVFGRTQTYYPWWSVKNAPVPKVWFHDVLHPDGSPFDPEETEFIHNITKIMPSILID